MNDVIRTCAVLDELVSEEGAVVLVESQGGHRVVRISLLGQLVRELAAEGIPFGTLVVELEAALGPAPERPSHEIVASAVTDLEAEGLVRRES